MLGSAVIVFREVLEAALIIAVVMGASRGAVGRGQWIAGGIALGLIGACVVAAFAGRIADALDGVGQELFNAGVLLLAVVMLAWHNIWMSAHGRKLAEEMQRLGRDVVIGAKPLSAMLAVTCLAVLREGSETVLFLYGLAAGGAGQLALIGGGALGLTAGALLGYALYQGLVHIPLRRFFTVTAWIILLLAAGLAASAADYLNQAGVLPALATHVWDTSNLLSQNSLVGQTLHILIGYQDRPSGIGLLAYVVTLGLIVSLMRLAGGKRRAQSGVAPHAG
jgi:high-affinity iron transporter